MLTVSVIDEDFTYTFNSPFLPALSSPILTASFKAWLAICMYKVSPNGNFQSRSAMKDSDPLC